MSMTQIAKQKRPKISRNKQASATFALMLMDYPAHFKRYAISRLSRIVETSYIEYEQDGDVYGHYFVILEMKGRYDNTTVPQTRNYSLVYDEETRPWTPCISNTMAGLIEKMSGLIYYSKLAPLVRDEKLKLLLE